MRRACPARAGRIASLSNRWLGLAIALFENGRYIPRTGLAVNRKPLPSAPGHKRVNIDVDLFDALTLTLEGSQSIESAPFPLLKRVIEFASILDHFGKPLPLIPIEPREADNHAIRRALGHLCT